MNNKQKVVITGAWVVSSYGKGIQSLKEGLWDENRINPGYYVYYKTKKI